MRQIILDTETTGLDPQNGHRMIEIGCVEMVDRRITGTHFHEYINPERDIDPGAERVHGISREFLSDKPSFAHICDAFLKFVGDSELIIHNAPFDIGFINHELKLLGHSLEDIRDKCDVIDTLTMARKMRPGQKNNLDALCKHYGIDNSNRELHGALLDSEILAKVYLMMTSGQDSLFEESLGTNTNSSAEKNSQIQRIDLQSPLKVIRSTDAEESEHANYLTSLKKTSNDNCIWQRDNKAES